MTDQSQIVDPCFPADGRLLCPEGPFERTFREVAVEGIASTAAEVDTSLEPWGVELTDGNRCRFSDGHTWPRDEMRLHFQCERGFLWGETDRSGDYWTLQFSEKQDSPLSTVQIAVAVW